MKLNKFSFSAGAIAALAVSAAFLAHATIPSFTAGSGVFGSVLADPVSGVAVNVAGSNPTSPGPGFGSLSTNSEGYKATYRYAVQGYSPITAPTAFLVIKGSATKTVRIKEIKVSGAATAAGNIQIQCQRWSTAGTNGSATLTAIQSVQHDINDIAATAVISTVSGLNYTTLGAGSGLLACADRVQLTAATSGLTINPWTLNAAIRSDKAIILRGILDFFVLSGNSSALPGGTSLDIEVETEEDNS